MSDKLVLIDGHSILNRAFFGLPDLTNSEGLHTNAVYGFLNILFKILEEEKPQYLAVAFDVHAPTFRHKMFDAYKGTRKPMADELREQVPLMKEMLHAMGVLVIEKEGYEADDVLGTLSVQGEKAGLSVRVISGDRDLLQLATDRVQIRIPKTKKTGTEIENYFAADVKEHYQVSPKEFIDVKALMGDTADNIPGVPGIGEKTATALIAQYHSIEAVHEHADEVKPPRAAKNIVEFWEQAALSKTLATIITDAPVEIDLSDAKMDGVVSLYTNEAYLLCKRLEFKNLLNRFSPDAPQSDASASFCRITTKNEADAMWERAAEKDLAFFLAEENGVAAGLAVAFGDEDIYFLAAGEELSADGLIAQLESHFCENTGGAHGDESSPVRPAGPMLIARDIKSALHRFDALCGGAAFGKIGEPDDFDEYLARRGRFFDVMIAAYLLNPLKGEYPYEDIAKDHLGQIVPSRAELLQKRSVSEAMEDAPDAVFRWACLEAYTAWKAYGVLSEALSEQKMERLFYETEMPVAFVLYDMEKEGICMDADALFAYGKKLSLSIGELEQRIYERAGEQFNINSPKQLGVILFEKLMLPNGKKTKTGYSTSAEVLEKLSADYPIVADILEFRQLSKLKSTYADGLLNVCDDAGKIHTTFNQTVTATGRLSSTEPNLQNIPIRIELGKQIRKVFHPADGNLFIDSDYSQIELRLLAHMSGDKSLIEAFAEGRDIHRTTASQVFHVPFDEVSDLQRRNAKAVNFGIVYGISAFGLSQDLSISRKEAQEYIDSYFATYPSIRTFLDNAVSQAKKDGYIRTLFGRIRPIPELSSGNFMTRQFGERVAMNSPIQGTAADIIKIAMVRVHDRLIREHLKSKLILQVHDELLIEAAMDEKETVISLLEEEMQKAADLTVTLSVGTASGGNWYDAH